ncbi:hypothetical protein ACWD7C_39160 [Streptomyces sp. NPDC005134]
MPTGSRILVFGSEGPPALQTAERATDSLLYVLQPPHAFSLMEAVTGPV